MALIFRCIDDTMFSSTLSLALIYANNDINARAYTQHAHRGGVKVGGVGGG